MIEHFLCLLGAVLSVDLIKVLIEVFFGLNYVLRVPDYLSLVLVKSGFDGFFKLSKLFLAFV
jgi:hypothetical protein